MINSNGRVKYYFIRVTNVNLFNAMVKAAEHLSIEKNADFDARRSGGFYELATASASFWHDLYLYGQMIAQAQDEFIDGGEERPA